VEPLAVETRLSITTRPDLVEMDAGSWTNHRLAALRRRRAWRDVLRSPGTFRFPGGESFPEAQERLIAEVGRIAARHPRGRVAVATHGDMVRILLCHFSGAPLDRFQRTTIDTASVSVVEIHRGAPRILLVNDTDGGLERFAPGRGEPPWESPTARRRSGTKVRG
jgi:broad specificity phosphatase PhoE